MNEENKEKLLNLLADKALFGLSESENNELERLKLEFPEFKNDNSFEMAAAMINLSALEINEPLPAHLQSKILNNAEEFFAEAEKPKNVSEIEVAKKADRDEIAGKAAAVVNESQTPWWSWLGWGVAALASIALAANLWLTRLNQPNNEIVKNPDTVQTPTPAPELSAEQKLQQLLASANDKIQTAWAEPDPKKAKQISGDVVWSNAEQKGYMRFRGLPANDPNKETYQLWIFDENQSDKYPIDGGVFNVSETGEVVVPIDPKLKVKKPTMFAITVEKPGGVVVSDRQRLLVIAKV